MIDQLLGPISWWQVVLVGVVPFIVLFVILVTQEAAEVQVRSSFAILWVILAEAAVLLL